MIRPDEFNATGPLAAVASAALLLLVVGILLRRRRHTAEARPRPWPDSGSAFLEIAAAGPPPPLAFAASIFFHLIALSLVPFAGALAPEILVLPPKSDLILIEYRVSHGTALQGPRYTAEPSAARETGSAAEARHDSRTEAPVDRTAAAPEAPEEADTRDIEVARFDAVIQMVPPEAPAATAIGEIWDGPVFVLDWRAPRTRPSPVVLAETAALDEISALRGRMGALPELVARERFELQAEPAGAFANAALADYGSPIANLAARAPDVTVRPRVEPVELGFSGFRLDAWIGRRSLAYLISSLMARPALENTGAGKSSRDGRGNPTGGGGATRDRNGQNPARPVDRHRYGIILVGSGTRGAIPAADGWLTGNPIYTVYLNVPGSARRWVLQFCRPKAESQRLELTNGVIRLLPRRALDPPFARRMEPFSVGPDAGGHWARAVVFARLDSAGTMSNLQIVSGPGGEGGERILAGLRGWEFQPAFEDGTPVSVEAIFSIPLN